MRGIRLTHKVPVQLEEVPGSFASLQTLIDRTFPKLKVETIKCTLAGLRSEWVRGDEDWREACHFAELRKVVYLDLVLAGKEPMSFCWSKPKDQSCAKLPKAIKAKTEKTSTQLPDSSLYGKLPCFKCPISPPARFSTCKLCANSGEISLSSAPPKYKALIQTLQTSIESLVKRVVTMRETREREKKEGVHEGFRCRVCGAIPIVGVRYQCSVCTDFNICSKCEEMVQHQHFFIKFRGQKSKCEANSVQNKGETNTLILRFVKDVIGKEGDKVFPGAKFPKVWRVRNDGKVEFPDGCMLVYTNGDFGGEQVAIPPLKPGEECDLAVECTPPMLEGRYTSFWRAVTPEGIRFGHRITIDVMVVEHEDQPTPVDLSHFRELLMTHPVSMQRALVACKGDLEAAIRHFESAEALR